MKRRKLAAVLRLQIAPFAIFILIQIKIAKSFAKERNIGKIFDKCKQRIQTYFDSLLRWKLQRFFCHFKGQQFFTTCSVLETPAVSVSVTKLSGKEL